MKLSVNVTLVVDDCICDRETMTSNSKKSKKNKLKMKEFVCKWKESQKEVVAKQEDKLSEVVVLYSERDDHDNWITCEVCSEEFENQEELDQHQEELYEVFENACAREREKEDYIECKDCEYSTNSIYYFGRHTKQVVLKITKKILKKRW